MKRRYLFFVITLLFVLLFSANCNAQTIYYQTQTPIHVYEGDEIRLEAYLPNSYPSIHHSEFLIDTGSGYSSSKPTSYITLNGNYRFEEMERSEIFNKCIYAGGNLRLSISQSGTYKVKGASWGYYLDTAHDDGSRVSHNLGIYEWTIIVEKKYVEPTPPPPPTTKFIIE